MSPKPNRLRALQAEDLDQVLAWRNHPQIARYMRQPDPIPAAAHAEWFARSQQMPERHLLIFEQDATARGFVQFQLDRDVADWGFYAAPEAPRGTGRALGHCALDHAFDELALHKVCGQVLSSNPRSLRFHERLGFKQEGLLREQQAGPDGRLDLICYGLLKTEWDSLRTRA